MLNPFIIDELMAEYTANELREILINGDPTTNERANIIAAIYYLEGTENND